MVRCMLDTLNRGNSRIESTQIRIFRKINDRICQPKASHVGHFDEMSDNDGLPARVGS